jgi:hypothetical protein
VRQVVLTSRALDGDDPALDGDLDPIRDFEALGRMNVLHLRAAAIEKRGRMCEVTSGGEVQYLLRASSEYLGWEGLGLKFFR